MTEQHHHHHNGHDHTGQHLAAHVHSDHAQHDPSKGKASWRMAASATLHCLTGCAIGEVLGLVLATAFGWATAPSIAVAVVLAFFFGYLLTLFPLRRAGVGWGSAIKLALAADTVSCQSPQSVETVLCHSSPQQSR